MGRRAISDFETVSLFVVLGVLTLFLVLGARWIFFVPINVSPALQPEIEAQRR